MFADRFENRLLQPLSTVGELHDAIKRREQLGGMLSRDVL